MDNFQSECCRPWTKETFQELVFKAVKNRKRIGQLITNMSDQQTENSFFQHKVTIFETMMANTNEVNRDKTKVPE